MLEIIQGESTVYLFNPKHKEDILHKENNQIKKWAHKKIIRKGDILFIPTNWYYFQETKNSVYQFHYDIDNILENKANFIEQDHSKATYASKIQKAEGEINWNSKLKILLPPGKFELVERYSWSSWGIEVKSVELVNLKGKLINYSKIY